MSAALRENELTIRACILYEVLNKNPIQESYENFCRKVGNNVMSYYDFDFWFYRFYNGNHDLHYDRSADPVPLSLSNITLDAIREILTHLGFVDLFTLMRVSRNFQTAVQNQNIVNSIRVHYSEGDNLWITYNGHYVITYKLEYSGCTVTISDDYTKDDEDNKNEIFFPGEDHWELCNKDFKCLLENGKVTLSNMGVHIVGETNEFREKCMKSITEALESAKNLSATKVQTSDLSFAELAQLLSIFPAENLREIIFTGKKTIGFEQVIHLDQWRNTRTFQGLWDLNIPIEHFLHFSSFVLSLAAFTEEDALKLRNMIDRSPDFFHADVRLNVMNKSLLERVFIINYDNSRYVYETPDNRCFIFKFNFRSFEITKL